MTSLDEKDERHKGVTSRGMTLRGEEGEGCHGDKDDVNGRGVCEKITSQRGRCAENYVAESASRSVAITSRD